MTAYAGGLREEPHARPLYHGASGLSITNYGELQSFVDVPPISNPGHGDLLLRVVNPVKNSIVADANAPLLAAGQFHATGWTRVGLEALQCAHNPPADFFLKTPQVAGSA